ncbi:MAG: hypothetical protein DRQ55_00900 [Planctomycetota bacterium]|nr:MAG: hypothetical protein DRQ55_00900 [Planctomycetota bacterium]
MTTPRSLGTPDPATPRSSLVRSSSVAPPCRRRGPSSGLPLGVSLGLLGRPLGLALLALLACMAPLRAQGFGLPGSDAGHAHATLHHRLDGQSVQVVIAVEIDAGWHLYHDKLGKLDGNDPIGNPTKVSLSAEGARFGPVRFPEPLTLDQPGLDSWIWGHEHELLLYALGVLEDGATLGELSAELEGLTCEDMGLCVLYFEQLSSDGPGSDALFAAFPSDLTTDAAQTGSAGAPASVQAAGSGSAARAEAVADPAAARSEAEWDAVSFPDFSARETDTGADTRGLMGWLLLAFLAGMILNVMPCVLPVISIKVLSFVQQAGEDRKRILALGLSFAAGIVTIFLVLAVLAATIGLSWGEQFQSPAFLIVMIGVVFAFALSLFGVFELGVPAGVGGLAAGPAREGLVDAYFKGMLATVLATPCSGPFLGSTLTWTLSQPAVTIFAIFLSLGLGMALPYVILTANPALLRIVPKPGPWMDTFKHAMGFVLLATVLFLMISLSQELLLYTIMFLTGVAFACWWYGRFAGFDKTRGKRRVHLALALLMAAGAGRLAFVEIRGVFTAVEHDWVAFEPDAFAAHLAAGDNVLVDFTADWCFNCKYNENAVYNADEVVAAMAAKSVVRMKADITRHDGYTSMLKRLMQGLGGSAVPFLAIFPGDEPSAPHVRSAIVTQGDILGVVESLPSR